MREALAIFEHRRIRVHAVYRRTGRRREDGKIIDRTRTILLGEAR